MFTTTAAERDGLTGNLRSDLFSGFGATARGDSLATADVPGLKSPLRAALYSAVIPGAGDLYAESYWTAAAFFTVEVALLAVVVSYGNEGDSQTAAFEAYADEHWSVEKYALWIEQYATALNPNATGTTGLVTNPTAPYTWDRVDWTRLNQAEESIGEVPSTGLSHRLPRRPDQPGEPCDGSSDADCPGNCSSGCACGGICGNAVMEAPDEECDDGNVTDGDGCSSACQMESPSGACAGMPASPGAALAAELIASGLDSPVHVAAPPLDPRRLFIVEQPGRILLVRDGALQPTPFLDISGKVLSGGERGLLSIAFDPAYEQNGRLFVNYTRKPDGDTVVARYQASTDDVADDRR